MPNCDVCNASISLVEGKRFTADEFRRAVAQGFELDETMVGFGMSLGQSRQQVIANWKTMVSAQTSDWLLCCSCAGRAGRYR